MTTADRNEAPATLALVKRAHTDQELESLPSELREWLATRPDGCLV